MSVQDPDMAIMLDVMQKELEIPYDVQISPACRELLHKLLVKDPRRRITIPQVMRHPWFKEGLPDSAMRLNKCCLSQACAPEQSMGDVRAVLLAASTSPACVMAGLSGLNMNSAVGEEPGSIMVSHTFATHTGVDPTHPHAHGSDMSGQ
eukprot:356939-Chlamydomonas_euryale.AAC.9